MNQAQVLDAYRLDRIRRVNETAATRLAAYHWVAQFPELCNDDGSPCSYAIEAALHYRRLGGPFGLDVVRRHRDMKVASIIQRLGGSA